MNYSDNEMKIFTLQDFQLRIISYLKIFINKNYSKIENNQQYSKKYLRNFLQEIESISNQVKSELDNELMDIQKDHDLLFGYITTLLESVKNSSELSKKDVIEPVEECIQEGEYKYSQMEISIPRTYNMEKLSKKQLIEFIQKYEDDIYINYQIQISNIWKKLSQMSNSIESAIIIDLENSFTPIWILPTSTFEGFEGTPILQILDDGFEEGLTCDKIFLNKLMVSSRIIKTLESWTQKNNSCVKKRIAILKEAITAHLEEKYYLSVSTLIPQIEGLLKNAVEEAEIKDVNLRTLTEGCIQNAADKLARKWKEENDIMGVFAALLDENFPKVIAYLYKPQEEIDEENKLNRHQICHGGIQTDFGIATNSLRLILIIDRIIFFMANDKNDK